MPLSVNTTAALTAVATVAACRCDCCQTNETCGVVLLTDVYRAATLRQHDSRAAWRTWFAVTGERQAANDGDGHYDAIIAAAELRDQHPKRVAVSHAHVCRSWVQASHAAYPVCCRWRAPGC